jgi:hypothetical protein
MATETAASRTIAMSIARRSLGIRKARRMGSREWGVGSGEWGIGAEFEV